MSLVSIHDASFSYGATKIFEHVGFSLGKGEIFCLLGPNGCGKTTLLDCILGFHWFESGTLKIMGKDVKRRKRRWIARSIAYVPQIHERTFPYTVREIVTMGRAAHLGLFESPSAKDMLLADEALDRINIRHLSHRPYVRLSGGEIQLVMIARALVQQTPVMIMDEPTAHLDFRYELVIMEVITDLVKEGSLSVIMATHFPNHAFYFQNNGIKTTIALLYKGGFITTGAPDVVLNADTLRKLYGIHADVISLDNGSGRTVKHIIPLRTVNDIENNCKKGL